MVMTQREKMKARVERNRKNWSRDEERMERTEEIATTYAVRDQLVIELQFDGLRVIAYVAIRRILAGPSRVPHFGPNDARHNAERRFRAPKAAHAEGSLSQR